MARARRKPRLRRADCSAPGLRRLRRGKGFTYLSEDRGRIGDAETISRIKELAIPPAWNEVWICADPLGHLQATGIDAAGRKQYLYHERWRELRDREKFDRMVRFAAALPRLRRRVHTDLELPKPSRERVLACAARLLDVGLFRIGGEQYAQDGGGLGLATIRKQHVTLKNGSIVFDYPAKSGVRRLHAIDDPRCAALIGTLKRRRGPRGSEADAQLLAYREGWRWVSVHSDDVNGYLKAQMGGDFSAKDFRTWNATMLAAVSVAADGSDAQTKTARRRAINGAVRGVADVLGNTPAVARRAYIDPRVFDRFQSGWTIAGALEQIGNLDTIVQDRDRARSRLEHAVLDLLAGETKSPIQRAASAGGQRAAPAKS